MNRSVVWIFLLMTFQVGAGVVEVDTAPDAPNSYSVEGIGKDGMPFIEFGFDDGRIDRDKRSDKSGPDRALDRIGFGRAGGGEGKGSSGKENSKESAQDALEAVEQAGKALQTQLDGARHSVEVPSIDFKEKFQGLLGIVAETRFSPPVPEITNFATIRGLDDPSYKERLALKLRDELVRMDPGLRSNNERILSEMEKFSEDLGKATEVVSGELLNGYADVVAAEVRTLRDVVEKTGTGPARGILLGVLSDLKSEGFVVLKDHVQTAIEVARVSFDTISGEEAAERPLAEARTILAGPNPDVLKAAAKIEEGIAAIRAAPRLMESAIGPDDIALLGVNLAMGLAKPAVRGLLKSGMIGTERYAARRAAEVALSGSTARTIAKEVATEATSTIGGRVLATFNPVKVGPLHSIALPGAKVSQTIADTFRSATYVKISVLHPTKLYRVFGRNVNKLGRFWTTAKPTGPLQAQADLALVPTNTLEKWVEITVPPDTILYEGTVASLKNSLEGELLGGAPQVYVDFPIPENWITGEGKLW